MISKNIRTNNEFYVCPVFNEAIQDGKKIKIFNIEKMWGLGTPEDLSTFLNRWKMDFSIGIITDGSADNRISKIIQSIINQNIPNYEIIIVGNSSVSGKILKL